MTAPSSVRHPLSIEHITIEATKTFEHVKTAFENLVPPLDPNVFATLLAGEVDRARDALERLPPLSIFAARNHGGLLQIVGPARKAIQYEIGNPLTATRMTRVRLSASLYAPLRVTLYESAGGRAVFEYDLPSSLLGQFDDERITAVGRELDAALERVLLEAAH